MSSVALAPAPWKLKGQSWLFTLSGLSSTSNFPAGFATEAGAEVLASGGEFIGGQGLAQLVSYSESPVGPYDELIYIPGRWKYPNGRVGFRITRIYVSTKESTENGRINWNIPKQVADFDFKPGTDGVSMSFAVRHPGSTTPFFQATLKPIALVSSLGIPFSTTILGKFFSLVQPPLPAGDKPEEVATNKWAALTPIMKGNVYLGRVTPGIDGKVGDGAGFPAVTPWSICVCMDNVDLDFGIPDIFDSL
ncbi:hypothetical protein BD779DRAFT_1543337 [Infundibulicybe gibba]|nr:hypothetical protein BD779DRAFT_1543337 [Infundibulicybe gibba]